MFRMESPSRTDLTLRFLKIYILPGLAFFAVVRASHILMPFHTGVTPIWPAAGVAFAAAYLIGLRCLPGLLLADVLALSFVLPSITLAPPIAIGNVLGAASGALLLRREDNQSSFLDSLPAMALFCLCGPILSAGLSTLLGVLAVRVMLGPPPGATPPYATWLVSNITGIIVVAPLVIAWARKWPGIPAELRSGEGLGVLALTLGLCHFVFSSDTLSAYAQYPLPFLFIPSMAWATFRASHRTITLMLAGIFLYAAAFTLADMGHFSAKDAKASVHMLQIFTITAAITSLVVHTLVDSLRSGEQELRRINEELEERVANRTQNLNRALENLKEAEASYRTIFENASEGIYRTDLNNRFTKANTALAHILGYPDAESLMSANEQMNFFMDAPEDRPRFFAELSTRGRVDRFETRTRRRDGKSIWVSLSCRPIMDQNGNLEGTEGLIQDITERKLSELDLERRASRDPLTGAANRDLFNESFSRMLAQAKRSESGLALLFLDMDGFKAINDTLGHRAGDAVLVETASRIRSRLRESDLLARIGGDEFAILAHDVRTEDSVRRLAEGILEALHQEFVYDGSLLPIRVSIGASLYPTHAQDMQTLLDQADAAMYKSKQQGKSRAFLWSKDPSSTG